MTITIGYWFLPLAVTLWVIGWSQLTPLWSDRGDFDRMFFSVIALILSLVVWLVYFLVRTFWGLV